MSADNALVVKKVGPRDWRVWMGFLSDDNFSTPPPRARWFRTREEALVAAHNWMKTEVSVEYGVQEIEA